MSIFRRGDRGVAKFSRSVIAMAKGFIIYEADCLQSRAPFNLSQTALRSALGSAQSHSFSLSVPLHKHDWPIKHPPSLSPVHRQTDHHHSHEDGNAPVER